MECIGCKGEINNIRFIYKNNIILIYCYKCGVKEMLSDRVDRFKDEFYISYDGEKKGEEYERFRSTVDGISNEFQDNEQSWK